MRAQQGRTPSRGTAALAPRCRQIDARPGVGPCRFRLDHVGGATSCRAIFKAISDPLFSEDPDGTPVGYLVESVEPIADYTEWTLKIRDGISSTTARRSMARPSSSTSSRASTAR